MIVDLVNCRCFSRKGWLNVRCSFFSLISKFPVFTNLPNQCSYTGKGVWCLEVKIALDGLLHVFALDGKFGQYSNFLFPSSEKKIFLFLSEYDRNRWFHPTNLLHHASQQICHHAAQRSHGRHQAHDHRWEF